MIEEWRQQYKEQIKQIPMLMPAIRNQFSTHEVEYDFRHVGDLDVRDDEKAVMFYEDNIGSVVNPRTNVIDTAILARRRPILAVFIAVVSEQQIIYISLYAWTPEQWEQAKEHRVLYHNQFVERAQKKNSVTHT